MSDLRSCNVVFIFGTSAELIKLWPLMVDLSTETETHLLSTNQQPVELTELSEEFGLTGVVELRNAAQGNLVTKSSVPKWAVVVGWKMLRHLRKIRRMSRSNNNDLLVMVHGDTMTCLIGAFIGRIARCKVAHVEAGLRSHDWRNPFPEELDRVLTARLAQFHFCPDQTAIENLAGRRGFKVNTRGNTSIDTMFRIQSRLTSIERSDPYVLVSLHRAELLSSHETLSSTVHQLVKVSEQRRVVMVLDALTKESLRSNDLMSILESSSIELMDKMSYPKFLRLVLGAERVVTDSGGLQEECGFLLIPCLVHRKATERSDGIGTTARLSNWEPDSIENFCSCLILDGANDRQMTTTHSPTAVIVEALKSIGLVGR